jgi:hypothetical protein
MPRPKAILPHSFSERLRPPQPDGSWRDWTILQFSDFFRMRLMAARAGLWLDADVLLLKAGRDRPGKALLRVGAPAPARQFGFVLPAERSDRAGVRGTDGAGGSGRRTGWRCAIASPSCCASMRHRSSRLSDIRVAIYGPAAITALARRSGELQHALPKQSFYAVHAEPKRFFEPIGFFGADADPEIIGCTFSPKGRGGEKPIPGSLYAWAAEKFGK